MANTDRMVLGSGDTYVLKYTGEIPEDATIETPANLIGETSGGGSIEYSKETYTATSDNGKVKKTISTSEEVKLKSGICTFSAANLAKLISTGRVSTSGKKDTLKLGGLANDNDEKYVVRFVHKEGDIEVRATIVGKCSSGLTFAFQKDKETVVDAEWTAEPSDEDGTLLILEFNDPTE